MSRWGDRIYAHLVFWPTWIWNIALGRLLKTRDWWNEIDPSVLLGARPFRRDLPVLKEAGVGALVNTCEEFPGFTKDYERLGIEQLYIPTIDFTHPSLQAVEEAVRFIDAKLAEGKKVYIHCKAGRGRSATVAICWLMHSRGMSLDQAQQHLLKCRPHVNARLTERPVVREYAAELSAEAGGRPTP
jgi:atypical dual specificity phosphatase